MSAQGLNSSTFNGVQYVPGGIPNRDASDYTRRLKQRAMYREYTGTRVSTGSTTPYNNPYNVPVDYSIVQSNESRLTYNFGLFACRFPCEGPLPDVPVGS
jgi:hypothetical protein